VSQEHGSLKVEVRTEPGSRAVLDVELPEDEVARAMDKAYVTLARRVQVPGFRRGKAPRDILERFVGTDAVREEALRRLLPESYSEAVTKAGIEPISRPSIEVKGIGDGKGLRFTATVDVYPEVTLPDYRALRVSRSSRPLTDEDVDRALEDLRSRHGRLVSAGTEAARRGDFVFLQVTAAPAGLDRLEAGKELLVEVGGGLLPAAVEAAVEGAHAGDDRTAQVEEAGEVTVHVADVRRKELPPLDDAFAKLVSDQPTVDALRENLRTRLARERADAEAEEVRDRALDAVLAQTTVDLPESLVQHEVEHMLEDLSRRLQSRGLSLESYLRSSGKDEAALRGELRDGAARRIRTRLVLDAVTRREALTISEEEMGAEVEKLAGDLQQDVPKVQAWLAEGDRREGLRETLLRRKAMAVLVALIAGAEESGSPADAPEARTPTPGESA
jgi:trigger factor